jgi:hypothetical protein
MLTRAEITNNNRNIYFIPNIDLFPAKTTDKDGKDEKVSKK